MTMTRVWVGLSCRRAVGVLCAFAFAAALATGVGAGSVRAQTSQVPASPVPASPVPASPVPASPVPAQAMPAPPLSPAAPAPAQAPVPTAPPGPSDQRIEQIASRPALVLIGESAWEDGYATLTGAFQRLKAEAERAQLKGVGAPVAVFVATDDLGFRFEAMAPLAEAPAGETQLGSGFKLGRTPEGRVVKFEHRGSYEEIDATYEAITAWLDEKNLDARDFFVEEFVNPGRGPDDSETSVDVYVFVK